MRLTGEDRSFLEHLAPLLRSGLLKLCQDRGPPHAFDLTCPSWYDAERALAMSRQAIRRRAWRIFNGLYVPAYETVMLVEQHLGPDYRRAAVAVVRDRLAYMSVPGTVASFRPADALLPPESTYLLRGPDRHLLAPGP